MNIINSSYEAVGNIFLAFIRFVADKLFNIYTLSRLFDAVAESKNIEANNHRKVLEKYGTTAGLAEIGTFEVKTTPENIKVTINNLAYEVQTLYPGFIRTAEEEKAPDGGRSFTWVREAGKKHLGYFRKAAQSISAGNESCIPATWLICPLCGYTYTPETVKPVCEFCLTKQERFIGNVPVSE